VPAELFPDLPTPALVVDAKRVEANLRRGQAYADRQGVALRPHAKTHKSPEFARRQLEAGAIGICVAKLGEAEVMVDAGIVDVFMANTVYGADKATRAVSLGQRSRFAIGADHPLQLDCLSSAARDQAKPLEVMIEVDTGAGRGGVAPEQLHELLLRVRELPGLTARGIYTYEGYTYGASDASSLASRHLKAQRVMVDLARKCDELFVDAPVVSMGSTPSLLAEVDLLTGISEIRPGTYIFLDAAQAALAAGVDKSAAYVLATVISVQGGRAIIDAGSKTLTSDARATGVTATRGYGLLLDHGLSITRLSEEHGVIEDPGASRLMVGQKVRVLPNHICPVVNLFPFLHLANGSSIESTIPVVARGLLV
jgi:D-serine deaminase-like pyridoxal phosphate-dependent protein